jgi:hypothetical protein
MKFYCQHIGSKPWLLSPATCTYRLVWFFVREKITKEQRYAKNNKKYLQH